MAENKRSYDVILGTFVAISLTVGIMLVFLVGRERRLFDTNISVEAHFPNVAGLAAGADVMLAGVVIGHVSQIKFPKLRPDMPGLLRDVTIVMDVSKSAMEWIREDSIARIDSKGLLGDKLINIAIGSPELPQVQPGGMLKSTPPVDFNKALQQAQQILENVTETVSDAKDIFKGFTAEGGDKALANSAKSIERILKEVETGNGLAHELIFDKSAGDDSKAVIANLKLALSDIKNITDSIRNKSGLIHALVYDEQGGKVVQNINNSFADAHNLLSEVRDGSGVLHDLIYNKDNGQFLRSFNIAAADLQEITKDIKDGRGSLGLLLKDPSVYNELYGLLGDLRRNRLLKAIIRYGISRGDTHAR